MGREGEEAGREWRVAGWKGRRAEGEGGEEKIPAVAS